jgi:hypothetical protein
VQRVVGVKLAHADNHFAYCHNGQCAKVELPKQISTHNGNKEKSKEAQEIVVTSLVQKRPKGRFWFAGECYGAVDDTIPI